jgi:type IV pilus assembly protein PilN
VRQRITEAASHATQLENQINQFKPQLAQVEAYRKTRQEIEQKLDVIESLERARSGPVRILDELATHTPERLWLTQLETNGSEITFQGMSLDNDFVALFLTALNESAYFANVELESTELKEEDGLKLNSFTVNAQLRRSDEDKGQAAGLPASPGR